LSKRLRIYTTTCDTTLRNPWTRVGHSSANLALRPGVRQFDL